MSQAPVKWVPNMFLTDKPVEGWDASQIPVVPLSALREVVEGLVGGTTKERVECVDWDAGYVSALNDLLASLGEGK